MGDHSQLACTACHAASTMEPLFQPTDPQDCVACHQADYQREHAGSGLPTTCLSCHSATSWTGATADHASLSDGFTLVGDHGQLACTACHAASTMEPLFQPTDPQDCVACHQADYQREHAGSGLPTTCATCHSATSWTGATADHGALSGGFTLVGDHSQLACTACHAASTMEPLFQPSDPQDCVACHQADYQREHAGSGLPTTCLSCHSATSWTGATADHGALSGGFTLVGDHSQLACTACHAASTMEPLFQPTDPQDCVACHQADYQREHAGSGLPTTCLSCHSATSWTGATADHASLSDGFTLVGDHSQLACSTCHILPGLEPIFSPSAPDDCIACHVADFQREHSGSGYPTTCLSCHVVTSWTGGQFNHDSAFFPIYSGHHQGRWDACTDCHTTAGDYGIFSCLNCHAHDKSRMDSEHGNRSGYVYESTACLSCHPRGSGE